MQYVHTRVCFCAASSHAELEDVNPLQLCVSVPMGGGAHCLFFRCDLYIIAASQPISKYSRQACRKRWLHQQCQPL